MNQAEGKDIERNKLMLSSAKELEQSKPAHLLVNSNVSDKSQNTFPTNNSNWHYLYEQESESDHRWDNFKKEEEEMRRCDAEREKQYNEKYGGDTEPCFPPCTDVTIQLPENLPAVDKAFIRSKVLEMKLNEEKAKEVACYYRNRRSELKAKILEIQKQKIEHKVQAFHEKKLDLILLEKQNFRSTILQWENGTSCTKPKQ